MSLHSANNLLKQRLKFCQQCSNKSFNPSTGIVCGLTQNKPNFEEECLDYKSENNDLEKAILTIPCPDCNNACSPKDVHCKKCGYKLTGEKVAISFADNILKVGEWIKYWQTYFQIILSPIKKTISIYEQGTQSEALKFAEQGAAIYILITFASITLSDIGLLDGFIKSVIFVVAYGTLFIVFQGFCSSASINDRTNPQILKIYCIVLGFILPISSVLGWLDSMYFPKANNGPLSFFGGLPLWFYHVRVWKYFWGIGGWKTFGYWTGSYILSLLVVGLVTILLSFMGIQAK